MTVKLIDSKIRLAKQGMPHIRKGDSAMGNHLGIAQHLVWGLRRLVEKKYIEQGRINLYENHAPHGSRIAMIYPSGIGVLDLPIFLPDGPPDSGNYDLCPGPFWVEYHQLAVFVSLKSPAYTFKKRGHPNLRQLMEKLAQHYFSCEGITKQYVVVTDNWDPSTVCEWDYIHHEIRTHGGTIETYFISVTKESQSVCEITV